VPYNAIIFIVVFDFIIALPYLGNPAAFTAIVSIATIGLYISYGIPIVLRVYKGKTFELGQFNLGKFGVPIGIIAGGWIWLLVIVFVLPEVRPVASANLNYACVLVGAVFFGSLFAWIWARKYFKGPPPAVPPSKRQSTRSLVM